jgi:DNA-binding CsgD family transcriptional regulator
MESEIQKLKQQKKTNKEIAEILGCSRSTVSKYNRPVLNDIGKKIIELRKQKLSIKQIAEQLKCSKATVSKWANTIEDNEDIKTENKTKLKKPKVKKRLRLKPKNNFAEWKKNVRHKRKQFLCSNAGNKCCICGYNKTQKALIFHHIDPIEKLFDVSGNSFEKNIDEIIKEAGKCILVCANCHAEIHENIVDISKIPTIKITEPIPEEIQNYKPEKITKEQINQEYHWLRCKTKSKTLTSRTPTSDINLSKIVIKSINKEEFDNVLEKYHYLGQSNKGHIGRFGFYYEDTLVGICLITNPVRATFNNTSEISRFCLCFEQKNLASKCLSLIIKHLKTNYDFEYVQAFSQDDIHLGTIYKAANFRMMGSSRPSYNYDGIHKKTIYERAKSLGLSEHEYADLFNLNRITESSKTKFIYNLRN